MLKKITKTGLLSVFLFIVLVGIGVFLFILDYERRQIKLSENNIQIVLSEDEWTKKDFELTIKYSGNANPILYIYVIHLLLQALLPNLEF